MAVDGSFWEGHRGFLPAPDAIDNEFSRRADDAMFVLYGLRVDDGFASPSAHSRRGTAHEPASPIGFPNVAATMMRARPARKICCVTASVVS
jgi:hypothetical protein